MFIKKIFRKRIILSLLLIVLLMFVSYAFAAANTVPQTGAGDGQGTISGYTVTNVHYTLSSPAPTSITAVSFTITPAAGVGQVVWVQVRLVSTGSWFTCDVSGAPVVTCDTTGSGGVTVAAADQFRVVAQSQ
jgi:hypothetical protein